MLQIYLLLIILLITIILFAVGRLRHDVVALLALMAVTVTGIVPFKRVFLGFSNPAVITVACVMMITYTITESGVIAYLGKKCIPLMKNTYLHIGLLSFFTMILSCFMNNVAALALMMPLAIQTAQEFKRSPSILLMPLAFSAVLGGLSTEIGTPPNLLISSFRQEAIGIPYHMFDFTPVGLPSAIIGVLFITFIGWRLLPKRKSSSNALDLFQIQDYITEISFPKNSPVVGDSVENFVSRTGSNFLILGLIRDKQKHLRLSENEIIQAEDILIVQASHSDLDKIIKTAKAELVSGEVTSEVLRSDSISLMEAVVAQGSSIEGRNANTLGLNKYGLNLLAIARQGKPFKERLQQVNLKAGDVILLQGTQANLMENAVNLGLLPLVERGVKIGMPENSFFSFFVFFGAIVLASFNILPIDVAFALAVVILMVFNILPVRNAYRAIDWSIIVLLGAMIPVGEALKSTGATQILADYLIGYAKFSPVILLILLYLSTMFISDIMNNVATAVIMAPLAIAFAHGLNLSVDPFLMTVAVSCSSSFITPISHQNNTLVMGPGGYHFFDYLRMGFLLEILILCVAIPLIIYIWPF